MIIIPDVHGRSFWKEAVKQAKEGEKIIFLGDYVDPYPWENLDNQSVIDNFKEIIEFRKQNSENCILLLGNHDTEYFLNTTACRYMRKYAEELTSIYKTNLNLFKFIHIEQQSAADSRIYTFSHGAILKNWVNDVANVYGYLDLAVNNIKQVADTLNNSLFNEETWNDLRRSLDMSAWCRGGYSDFGSPIWGDVREIPDSEQFENVYEIFGHTQLKSCVISPNWACLDCRRGFRLDEETGEIEAITEENLVL